MPVRNTKTNWNELKQIFFCYTKNRKTTEQIEFWFVLVRTEKKNELFLGPPKREGFLEIFSVCFDKVLFVSVVSIVVQNKPKQIEKMIFGFAKQTEKQLKQIESRFVAVRTEKKLIV
jgi:hypothetical protein